METTIFAVAATFTLLSALGVVLSRRTIYAAMCLVATLFGMAVLFLTLQAQFLAAVQVIVYAGAVVVLFLFVIMLLGINRIENLQTEPLVGQRWLGLGAALVVGAGLGFAVVRGTITGAESSTAPMTGEGRDVFDISEILFTDYLFAFEITSLLLVIGVVGAVALARRIPSESDMVDTDEPVLSFDDEAGTAGDEPDEPVEELA